MRVTLNTNDPYHLSFTGQSGMIVNYDPVNSVLLGPTQGAVGIANNPVCSVLDPLTAIAIDPEFHQWAIALTGSPVIQFLEGSQFRENVPPPGPGNLGGNAITLGTGIFASTVMNNQILNQPSYRMRITANSNGTPTTPFMSVALTWKNNSIFQTVFTDLFFFPISTHASPVDVLVVEGPVRGSQVSLTIQNNDPAATVATVWSFDQISDHREEVLAREEARGTIAGFTNPGMLLDVGQLASFSASIAATSTLSRLVPVFSGRVIISIDNSAAAAGDTILVTLTDPASLYSTAGTGAFASFAVSTAATLVQEVALPKGPVLLNVHNNGSTAVTPNVQITAGKT